MCRSNNGIEYLRRTLRRGCDPRLIIIRLTEEGHAVRAEWPLQIAVEMDGKHETGIFLGKILQAGQTVLT